MTMNNFETDVKITKKVTVLDEFEKNCLLPTLKLALVAYIRFSPEIEKYVRSKDFIKTATLHKAVSYIGDEESCLKLDEPNLNRLKEDKLLLKDLITFSESLIISELDCTCISVLLLKTLNIMNNGEEYKKDKSYCITEKGALCNKRNYIQSIRDFRNELKHCTATFISDYEILINTLKETNKNFLEIMSEDLRHITKTNRLLPDTLSHLKGKEKKGKCNNCDMFRHIDCTLFGLSEDEVLQGLHNLKNKVDDLLRHVDNKALEVIGKLNNSEYNNAYTIIEKLFKEDLTATKKLITKCEIPFDYEVIADSSNGNRSNSQDLLTNECKVTLVLNCLSSDLLNIYQQKALDNSDFLSLTLYIDDWVDQDLEALIWAHLQNQLPSCFSQYKHLIRQFIKDRVNCTFVLNFHLWRKQDKDYTKLSNIFSSNSDIFQNCRWIIGCSYRDYILPGFPSWQYIKIVLKEDTLAKYLQCNRALMHNYNLSLLIKDLTFVELVNIWFKSCNVDEFYQTYPVCHEYLESVIKINDQVQLLESLQKYAFSLNQKNCENDDNLETLKTDLLKKENSKIAKELFCFTETGFNFKIKPLEYYLAGKHIVHEKSSCESFPLLLAVFYHWIKTNCSDGFEFINKCLEKTFSNLQSTEVCEHLIELNSYISGKSEVVQLVSDFFLQYEFVIDLDTQSLSSLEIVFSYIEKMNPRKDKKLVIKLLFHLRNSTSFLRIWKLLLKPKNLYFNTYVKIEIKNLEQNESSNFNEEIENMKDCIMDSDADGFVMEFRAPVEFVICENFKSCKAMSKVVSKLM